MSGMDVEYTYCLNLTKEEKYKIDEDARQSRMNLIFRILLIVSPLLGSCPAEGAPLPGADGFPPPAPPARARRNPQCRTYGIFSRIVTGINTELQGQPGSTNNYHDVSLDCIFEKKQIQKKFKHAKDFGISGNYSAANGDLFRKKLIEHMKSTHACLGTYRGNEVYHYYDPNTNLNVMVNRNNNKFVSGWELSPAQQANMKRNGNIQ